jgi:hypothetical protein
MWEWCILHEERFHYVKVLQYYRLTHPIDLTLAGKIGKMNGGYIQPLTTNNMVAINNKQNPQPGLTPVWQNAPGTRFG